MSANNWAQCPRCVLQADQRLEQLEIDVRESYGKVSVDEFDEMRDKLANLHDEINDTNNYRTLREDYEFTGAETGVLTISYSGNCGSCNLSLNINETREFPV